MPQSKTASKQSAIARPAAAASPQTYDRRIVAVIDEITPRVERRIVPAFSVLHEHGMMAGWAPSSLLVAQPEQSQDALVLTDTAISDETIAKLRKVGRKLILDLDMLTSFQDRDDLDRLLPQVDAVICANELAATRLRAYHHHVFVVPDVISRNQWIRYQRSIVKREPVVRMAVPTDATQAMLAAVAYVAEKHGSRLQVKHYDWSTVEVEAEPDVYGDFDIVLVPPPQERHQVAAARLLPPMAAACCIIADRLWVPIKHRHTGVAVGADDVHKWASVINQMVLDSRGRILMGRNARAWAMRMVPESRVTQIVLPYRIVVPPGERFEYAPAG